MAPVFVWMIIAFVLAVAFGYFGFRYTSRPSFRGDIFFWVIFCPVLIFFGTMSWVSKHATPAEKIASLVNRAFDWAARTVGLGVTQVALALGIYALGIGAHYFKRKNQKWYGNVEVLVGFLTAYVVAGTLKTGNLELSKWATLAGAGYVIARGLGNRSDASDQRSPKSPAGDGTSGIARILREP